MGTYSAHQHSLGHLQNNGSQLLPSLSHFQRQVDAELQHKGRSRRKGGGGEREGGHVKDERGRE